VSLQEADKPAAAAAAPAAEAEAPKEKPKNPMDALPPSKMVRILGTVSNIACLPVRA